ncbi:MAG: CD1108 family mobile element protein [Oscillospiraceae bacterium]
MTRDGAVQDNQATGEEIHISERDAEKQLSPNGQPVQMGKRDAPMNPAEDAPKHGRQLRPQEQKEPEKEQSKPQQPSAEPFQPQGGSPVSHIPQDIPTSAAPGGTAEKLFDRAAAEHDAHKVRQAVRMSRDAAQQRYSASRLQFSEEERAAPELHKHIHRAEKAADKLDAAQAAIPKKRVLRKERVFDEASGTAKTKLRFDTVDKSPPKLKPNPLGRPLREAAVQAHGKIHEVEHENVGVESGHKAEELAEHGAGGAIRWERRHRKLKPYRAAEKAERKAVNANAEYLYQKALHDNPEMLSGNPLNRFFQKQHLKREYAKAARTAKAAGSTAQATAKSAEKTAEATATAAKKAAEKAKEAAEFVARHWKGVLVVLAGFLLIVMLIGGLQSCSALVGAAGGGVAASSYQSEDADILAAEAAYCALEAELQEYLGTYERTHDYDEYHYDLDEIKHDPYVLASILSALHDGAWTASEVQGTLQMLFEKQYILTETVVTEVRYRTVTRTDSEGNEYEVEVPYNYYICTVELENFDLSHIPVYIMDEETLSKYALYMSVLGNKPELFGDSEYIPKYITNRPEGYEIPPSAMEDETFAAVITEAEKYLGYPYVWGGSSPSTSFDCSGFVSWVLTNSGVCNTGRLGAQGLYNISTPVSNPQPGDLVFFVGTYDTPGVSHVGIYVGNSMMIHCGDPISYSNLNSSYWQAHFYAYARPPYN